MKLWLLVFAMALVTYLPRMMPLVLLQNMKLPPRVNAFLQFVPFAALSALVFPGVLDSTGNTGSAVVGVLLAFILAFFRLNVIFVVFASIIGVFLWGCWG